MIDREGIAAMEPSIRPYIRNTPVLDLDGTLLKLELLQVAGSFKARGAFANLRTRTIPSAGVVAASGGNHGAAVAYAAAQLDIPCRIFVPEISSPAKVERIRATGADLHIVAGAYPDALAASIADATERRAMLVHAFDQAETILGAGSLGKELEEIGASFDTVLVPVGGGGLIAGVSAWFDGRVRVVGVEPEGAPTLDWALRAGAPVTAPTGSIASDSLAAGALGSLVYPIVARYVERVVLVSDDDIRDARQALWDRARIVAEPGGATAFAALLSKKYEAAHGERVAVIVSGGNTVVTWI
ncbi:MAG TPA: threonine/serine dehydratase [Verrucomicrobiae bacterium]|nr:threonine/serine dehydratase [Verrucomicrobiae bacterium]